MDTDQEILSDASEKAIERLIERLVPGVQWVKLVSTHTAIVTTQPTITYQLRSSRGDIALRAFVRSKMAFIYVDGTSGCYAVDGRLSGYETILAHCRTSQLYEDILAAILAHKVTEL